MKVTLIYLSHTLFNDSEKKLVHFSCQLILFDDKKHKVAFVQDFLSLHFHSIDRNCELKIMKMNFEVFMFLFVISTNAGENKKIICCHFQLTRIFLFILIKVVALRCHTCQYISDYRCKHHINLPKRVSVFLN